MPMRIDTRAKATINIYFGPDELSQVLPAIAARGLPFEHTADGDSHHVVTIELAGSWADLAGDVAWLESEFRPPA